MSDSADCFAAELFEVQLRGESETDPRNLWELLWLLSPPLDARNSYMRIQEARIDQDAARNYLRRQSFHQRRDWRHPPTQELECMAVQPTRPWASLGRRQQRRKVDLRSCMRPALTRNRSSHPAAHVRFQVPVAPGFGSPVPVVDSNAVPKRPSTPSGLRDFIYSDTPLTFDASGHDPNTWHQKSSYTPFVLATPSREPVSFEYPPSDLHPPGRALIVNGSRVAEVIAFVVATGRHQIAPWQGYLFEDVARDVYDVQMTSPGLLSDLVHTLFPSGMIDLTIAVYPHPAVLDFIMGWSVISQAHGRGYMPPPWQRCLCGEGTIPAEWACSLDSFSAFTSA